MVRGLLLATIVVVLSGAAGCSRCASRASPGIREHPWDVVLGDRMRQRRRGRQLGLLSPYVPTFRRSGQLPG